MGSRDLKSDFHPPWPTPQLYKCLFTHLVTLALSQLEKQNTVSNCNRIHLLILCFLSHTHTLETEENGQQRWDDRLWRRLGGCGVFWEMPESSPDRLCNRRECNRGPWPSSCLSHLPLLLISPLHSAPDRQNHLHCLSIKSILTFNLFFFCDSNTTCFNS